MRILVTGGAGFIGANLCRELLARPEVEGVTVLDDFSTGNVSNIESLPVEAVKETNLSRDTVAELVNQSDSVVHLAAQPSVPLSIMDPLSSHEVNVNGTIGIWKPVGNSKRHSFSPHRRPCTGKHRSCPSGRMTPLRRRAHMLPTSLQLNRMRWRTRRHITSR